MNKILAIDYGSKRVGLAVTDSEQIIASGLTTVKTSDLMDFLKKYFLALVDQISATIILQSFLDSR